MTYRYRFISEHRAVYGVKRLCRLLGVRRQGFYEHLAGQPARVQLVKNHRKTAIERVQIDFDRDEEWDELWFVRGKEVSRSVSPEDDGNYSERFALKNGKWQHM